MKVAVFGRVSDAGIRMHVIDAKDRTEAWERFCRAYARMECTFVKFETLMGKKVWGHPKK